MLAALLFSVKAFDTGVPYTWNEPPQLAKFEQTSLFSQHVATSVPTTPYFEVGMYLSFPQLTGDKLTPEKRHLVVSMSQQDASMQTSLVQRRLALSVLSLYPALHVCVVHMG